MFLLISGISDTAEVVPDVGGITNTVSESREDSVLNSEVKVIVSVSSFDPPVSDFVRIHSIVIFTCWYNYGKLHVQILWTFKKQFL